MEFLTTAVPKILLGRSAASLNEWFTAVRKMAVPSFSGSSTVQELFFLGLLNPKDGDTLIHTYPKTQHHIQEDLNFSNTSVTTSDLQQAGTSIVQPAATQLVLWGPRPRL